MSKAITEAMVEAAAKVLNERLAKEDGLFGVSRDMLSAALSSVPPAVPEEVETAHPTDNQVVAAVKAYISIEGKCRPAAMISALAAALSAEQAQPVAIKPLEWELINGWWFGPTAEGQNYIVRASSATNFKGQWLWGLGVDKYELAPSLEAAKAAAQSDYEARIRSALVPPAVPGEVETETIQSYFARQINWSRETFGPALRTKGVIEHIRKELREIEQDPHDLSEWIDVVILAMDGFWRHGGNSADLLPALLAKQVKNMARVWPDWRTRSEDQAIEHDRSHDVPLPEIEGEAGAQNA